MSRPSAPPNAAVPEAPKPAGGPVRHFIITRFNLRGMDDTPSSAKMIDEAYLAQRLELFERFCLPTVRSQTEQDFKWLVLFADETPDAVKARVAAHGAAWPNFVPIYLPRGASSVGPLVVSPYLDAAPQTLLTTRLDNDDGLARDYVAKVQRHAASNERLVLQFPMGYVWHNDRIYLDRQEHNAFTTLVEPLPQGGTSGFNTIYKGSHSDIERLGRVINVDDEPSWLQVIHGSNVENYRRGSRQRIEFLQRHFAVAMPASAHRESGFEIGLDRIRTFATSTATRATRSIKYRLGLYDNVN
jgi:hypothetical protein